MTSDAAKVRENPALYLSRFNELGANAALLDLVSHSFIELSRMPTGGTLDVIILEDFYVRVQDNGRGVTFSEEPGEAISHAEAAFGRFYPIPCPTDSIEEVLIREIWINRLSLGPIIANSLASLMLLESIRPDGSWLMAFERGVLVDGPHQSRAGASSTRLSVEFDREIFSPAHKLDATLINQVLQRVASSLGEVVVTVEDRRPKKR